MSQVEGELSPLKQALLAVQRMRARVETLERAAREPIAIIGAGLRLPGGVVDLASYWSLLSHGRDAVVEVPEDRWSLDAWYDPAGAPGKMSIRHGGFLGDVSRFDASFFGISPREAAEMDPAQRMLLQVAWEALESSGIPAEALEGARAGVYVGLGLSDYARRHFLSNQPERLGPYSGTGSFLSVAAGRISYFLGLSGPAVTVDTACSSSLVSVHLAVQALRTREIDVALAGGANLVLAPEPTVYFSQLQAMSKSGRCRAFDAGADGYVRGEGAAVVALKRLSDATRDGDRILGILRGSAVNQDGRSNGLTAPSARAQEACIRLALEDAGVQPAEVGYVEAHGTGTPLGDPIEFEALRAAYDGDGPPLRVGSVKTNFGHLETAAGVAGLLKLVVTLAAGRIPPHLHFQSLNPRITLGGGRLSVPVDGAEWGDGPRIGAVSSFGLSGTNAHLIVEAPPAAGAGLALDEAPSVVCVSARDPGALRAQAARLASFARSGTASVREIARAAAIGRSALPHRLTVVAAEPEQLAMRLEAAARDEAADGVALGLAAKRAPEVAFLFTGQGAQVHGMGRALYASEPAFRQVFDEIEAALVDLLPRRLREVMWADPSDPDLHDTRYTQPALFAVEVATAAAWAAWGVTPDWMFGHSVGEIAAAVVAGVMGPADGARMVAVRGRLMSELPRDGAMVAVFADEETVLSLVAPVAADAGISGLNGPTETVVSGRIAAVEAVVAAATARGLRTRALRVSHAFHSCCMDPILDAFEAHVRTVALQPPQRVVLSDLDGRPAGDRLTDPRYWRDHLRGAVRFSDGMATLASAGVGVYIEVGPAPILSGMGARCLGASSALFLPTSADAPEPLAVVRAAQGGAWVAGLPVTLASITTPERWIDLPTYAWQEERHWLEMPESVPGSDDPAADRAWEVAWRVRPPGDGRPGRWQIVGGSRGWATALAAAFERLGDVAEVQTELGPIAASCTGLVLLPAQGEQALAQALHATQALANTQARLYLVTHEATQPHTAADLDGAPLRGFGRVVALEHPERWGGAVDVVGALDADGLAATLRSGDEDEAQLTGAVRRVARLQRARTALTGAGTVSAETTWVITGGLGALGRTVARRLVAEGARNLVLVGRTGASSAAAVEAVEALVRAGARVKVAAVDVADSGQVQRLFGALDAEGFPRRTGVLHLAGTSDDAPLGALTSARVDAVLRPKQDGAWNLHEATLSRPVDAFVLFGSASAWFGTPGQAAYAAANAWLEGLARFRHSLDLPAQTIHWGPWEGDGMAGRVPAALRARWAEEGIGLLDPDEAMELLLRALGSKATVFAAMRVTLHRYREARRSWSVLAEVNSPEERSSAGIPAIRAAETGSPLVRRLADLPPSARPAALADEVHALLAAVLGLPAGRRLDPTLGFFDAGMDSLTALELRNRLQRALGLTLSATVAFDHPTVDALVAALLDALDLAVPVAAAATTWGGRSEEPIAIVGVSCRFPGGANDLDQFWSLLAEGRCAVREVPADRWDVDRYYDPNPGTPGKTYNRHAGLVDGVQDFEPASFGISPREAESLDPQQRWLLECAWSSLEDAGIDPRSLTDSPTGVYMGIGGSEYGRRFDPLAAGDAPDPYSGTGNESSFAAGRVAYVLGLRGPALSINTACSSSLVAVHQAVQALRAGECALALAGGANAIVGPETTVQLAQLRALAPDGLCKTFDAAANGYVRGEGAAVIVLRRLSDALAAGDRIVAVIRGSAVNHDGRSSGLTVPNGAAQQAVLRAALAAAGVAAHDVQVVECHGTGTPLGDPIEVRALSEVYGRGRSTPLHLGSVKTNLGHLEAAAGMAGLLKAVASLRHRAVPPILHLKTVNPALPLADGALDLPTVLTPLASEGPLRAAVSAFGISGTNAHVVLETAPPTPEVGAATAGARLVPVSARTEAGLQAAAAALAPAAAVASVADVARTLAVGRAALEHRAVVVAANAEEATAGLALIAAGRAPMGGRAIERPRVAFLCTGAGPQVVGMGRALYAAEPAFRAALDAAAAALDPHLERPLLAEVLYPADDAGSPIDQLAYTQPALFAFEYAAAQLWASWGVTPDAVIGHSTGQYVAAVLAGVMSLADGAKLIATRARWMSAEPEIGEMVAIFAPVERVQAALDHDQVSIAAINSAEEVVISGLRAPVLAIADRFEQQGVEVRRLRISHAAHSPLMDPVLDRFEALCASVEMHPPRLPFVENVRGEMAGAEVATPAYWRAHMREAVQFHAGMRTLAWLGYRHFLEIGNHPILCGNGGRSLSDLEAHWYPTTRRKAPERLQALETAARLWCNGVSVDLAAVNGEGRRIALPTTPFQRTRCWVERQEATAPVALAGADWTYGLSWRDAPAAPSAGPDRWLLLADAGGVAAAVATALGASAQLVACGIGDGPLSVDPERPEQLERLLADHPGAAVVHFLNLDAPAPGPDQQPTVAARRGTASALALIQAAARRGGTPVAIVTSGAVALGDRVRPEQAPVWGLANVAAMELPDLRLVRIDADPAAPLVGLVDALRTHDGEELVALRDGRRQVARLTRVQVPANEAAVRADATYLVTGGLGALGLRVAAWLVDRGARALLLVGRSAPGEAAQAALHALAAAGATVEVVAADVATRAGVDAVWQELEARAMPPLAGVFHAAGVLDDGAVLNLEWARFPRVWAAKVDGSWWLHQRTLGLPLDWFVAFSSAAAMIGSPGQGNYAAGNAYLDALIAHRRSMGLAGQSHAWGPWAEAGLAAESARAWTAGGVQPMVPRAALSVLSRLLAADRGQTAVASIDWATFTGRLGRVPTWLADLAGPQAPAAPAAIRWVASLARLAAPARRAALAEAVQAEVARVLRLDPAAVDPRVGFFDAGLDSLMAVEVVGALKGKLQAQLPATLLFDHPTVDALTDHLLRTVLSEGPVAAERPTLPVGPAPTAVDDPIAIIGMACRFPGGANDPDAFWALLHSGRDPMVEVPLARWDVDAVYDPTPGTPGRMYTREAGFVDWPVDQFDSEFFGISPREANSMDPQQRLLLEVAWEALENAGTPIDRLAHTPTAVYIGAGDSGYLQRFQRPGELLYRDTYAGTGNLSAFLAGRVAYVLGVQGPNLTLNTACSSSLVATHLAVQALRAGECGVALAGGVNLMLSPENFVYVSQIKAVAADGRCKTFDAKADGYGRAEGCGVVVMRRLSDAVRDGDPILAVIRGSAVGHDGASSGLTVPNGQAQQEVIRAALARASVDPRTVSFVETHGTGTVLGDPIEVHALEATYGVDRPADAPLTLGATKSVVGHMEVASGTVGLVKTLLAFQHDEIPPNLHFETPNPDLDFARNGFRVPTAPQPWPRGATPRRAGLSSFGLSGTNVHLVLEEAPVVAAEPAPTSPERTAHLLALSARSEGALRALASRTAERLAAGGSLPDLAWSGHLGRSLHDHRVAVVAGDAVEAAERLLAFAGGADAARTMHGVARGAPQVAMLFSGQGSQYAGMARALYDVHPGFRASMDACAAGLAAHLPRPLLEVIASDDGALDDTTYTQPALFAVEWSLAQLWLSWGLRPSVLLGHSIGELVAACVAGVFSLEDALRLVAARGRLMGSLPRDGAMVAVFAEGEVVSTALPAAGDAVSIAAVNHPGETVLSGDADAVLAVAEALKARGIDSRRLKVSHAFHSAKMDPILDAFEAVARTVVYHPPQIPLLSNLTGAIAGPEIADPVYWRRQLRGSVAFAAGIRATEALGIDTYVEVGPHPALLGMARRTRPELPAAACLGSLKRDTDDVATLALAVAGWVARGGRPDWAAWDAPWPRRRVSLPNYPWQRRRHWIQGEEFPGQVSPLRDWTTEVVWEAAPAVRGRGTGLWVLWADRGGVAAALGRALEARGCQVRVLDSVPATADAVAAAVEGATGVVHLGSLDLTGEPTLAALASSRERLASPLLQLVQAAIASTRPPRVALVTRGVQAIEAGEVPQVLAAPGWGLLRAARAEVAGLAAIAVDLDANAEPGEADALADALLAVDGEPEVALRRTGRRVPRLVRARLTADRVEIRPDGAYLITGGLTGLGLALAAWLVARGARRLVLVGRRAPSDEAAAEVARMEAAGAVVAVCAADVARAGDLEAVMAEVDRRGWSLRGVVHAAGVLDDAALPRQDGVRLQRAFAPKVEGTWNLHCAVAGRPLDFFSLFSAGASLMGAPGQSNYAAANAFVDAFAHWRRARGLPALAINWGAWAEIGMAARLGAGHAARQAAEGIATIPVATGMSVWGRLLGQRGQIGVLAVDWPKLVGVLYGGRVPPFLSRLVSAAAAPALPALASASVAVVPVPAAVEPGAVDRSGWPEVLRVRAGASDPDAAVDGWVHDLVVRVLDADRGQRLDPNKPLLEYGLDSLLAVELKNQLAAGGVDLPVARLMTGPPLVIVAKLVRDAAATLAPPPAASVVERAPPTAPSVARPALLAAVAAASPEGRSVAIAAAVHDLAVRVLDADRGRALDPDKPLLEYGLDSLLAVELKNQLAAAGVDLPVARIMTGPPLSVVSKLVEDWIAAHPEAVASPEPAVVDAPVRRGWDELSAGAGASGGSSAGEAPAPLPFNPVVSHLVAFLAGVFALIAAWVAGQVMGTHPVDNPDVGVEAPADARPALPGKAPVQKKKRGE